MTGTPIRPLQAAALAALLLASCSERGDRPPRGRMPSDGHYNPGTGQYENPDNPRETIFSKGGVLGGLGLDDGLVFGGSTGGGGSSADTNIWLWRASLDVASVLPLASSDFASGIITTEWYTPPGGDMNEKFRFTVRVSPGALRSDGVRVTLFRRVGSNGGRAWQDTRGSDSAEIRIEDMILQRARDLRVAGGGD